MKAFGAILGYAGIACIVAAAFMLHLILGLFVLGAVLVVFGFAALDVAEEERAATRQQGTP